MSIAAIFGRKLYSLYIAQEYLQTSNNPIKQTYMNVLKEMNLNQDQLIEPPNNLYRLSESDMYYSIWLSKYVKMFRR